MASTRVLAFIACLALCLSYYEVQAGLNKDCLDLMNKLLKAQTKLLVGCINELGLKTPAEKEAKALVKRNLELVKKYFLGGGHILKRFLVIFDIPGDLRKTISFLIEETFDDFHSSFQCVMKCVMIKGKYIGADGLVDMDLAQKLLEELPETLRNKAGTVVTQCGQFAGTLDPNDATCESYRDFVSCMLEVGLKLCTE